MNKKTPLVSILINNFNKDIFCVKAVKSVINQDYKNLEIIFYDDNSSDSSINKIKRFKKKLNIKKLTVIENKSRQNIFSYNQLDGIKKSLSKSKGKIICLLDSDDFFKKDKIKKVVKQFQKNKLNQILFDKPIYYYNNKNQKKNTRTYKIKDNKWPSFPPTSCISFQRKSLVKAIKKISIKKNKDLWFDFRAATYFAVKEKQFNLIDDNLTYYRQNSLNYDKRFIKFINIAWWRRREQAFKFLKSIDKISYNRNIYYIIFFKLK